MDGLRHNMINVQMSDNGNNQAIVNSRFDMVIKIAKYAPECGHLWPQYCHSNQWDTTALLYCSDVELVKMLAILDEMYGETMSIVDNKEFSNIFLNLFNNKQHILL